MRIKTVTFLLFLCGLVPVNAQEQKPLATPAASGGGVPVESNFRLIGSVSGSKLLEQSGRLVGIEFCETPTGDISHRRTA